MAAYWLAACAMGACFAGYQAHKAGHGKIAWIPFVLVLTAGLAAGYVMGVWR